MTSRSLKMSSIRLAPALAQCEHAGLILALGDKLRASFARANNIPIARVKLEITLSGLDKSGFLDAGAIHKSPGCPQRVLAN
jgi:hypothetical protein